MDTRIRPATQQIIVKYALHAKSEVGSADARVRNTDMISGPLEPESDGENRKQIHSCQVGECYQRSRIGCWEETHGAGAWSFR